MGTLLYYEIYNDINNMHRLFNIITARLTEDIMFIIFNFVTIIIEIITNPIMTFIVKSTYLPRST